MKSKQIVLLFGLLIAGMAHSFAQPFTLDKKLAPVKLQLEENKKLKGAKLVGAKGTAKKEGQYYYVKGHSMFQPVDIFLTSSNNKPVQMEVVKNNWNDIVKQASTVDAQDGIADIKVRAYGDFGIRVYNADDEAADYYLVVYAGPEVKNALPSPFVSADETAKNKTVTKNDQPGNDSGAGTKEKSSSSMLLIIGAVIVVLLLVIIALILRKKKGAGILLFFVFSSIYPSQDVLAQGRGIVVTAGQLNDFLADVADSEHAKKLNEIFEKIKKLQEQSTNATEMLEGYFGLGDCMNMPSPPGMPQIPSFCTSLEGTYIEAGGDSGNAGQACSDCFTDSRTKFNNVRYSLEQLRIIYKCTIDFSKKAISFGDDASGVHAVVGLTWQKQRAEIEKSVKDLKAAYDKKYAELLGKLHDSMIDMAICEEKFGLPDWYDRFGYMFYEFIKEKYRRDD